MTAKEFTGHVRAMRADTDYFGAEDFAPDEGKQPEDMPLQIAEVVFDDALKVGSGKAKPTFYLKMNNAAGRPCKKRMLLNASRRKMLVAMYGGTTANWKGKWVWVYTEPVKNPAGGDNVLGMKFRNKKDAPRGSAAKPVEPETAKMQPDALETILDAISRSTDAMVIDAIYDAAVGPDATASLDDNERKQVEAARADRLAVLREGAK